MWHGVLLFSQQFMLFELVSTGMLWYYCSLLLYYIVLNKPVSKPLWVAHVVFQTNVYDN